MHKQWPKNTMQGFPCILLQPAASHNVGSLGYRRGCHDPPQNFEIWRFGNAIFSILGTKLRETSYAHLHKDSLQSLVF